MAVKFKTAADLVKMRVAGRMAAEVLEMIAPEVAPGVTTDALNALCHTYIVETQQAIPAPLGYRGFPKSICTSVNHVVCHGIPGDKVLKSGDIINIDVTVIFEGYHGDTSKMFMVGDVGVLGQRLSSVTQACLYEGIKAVKPGARLGDLGAVMQAYAERHHYSVVKEYCGHGIGLGFHEDPQILHYGTSGTGMVLEPGMVFTIEPMLNAGRPETKLLNDGWTVVTRDRSLSAQWEHTMAVTDTGVEVLTLRSEERAMAESQGWIVSSNSSDKV